MKGRWRARVAKRPRLPGAMLLLSNEVNTLNEIIFTIAGYRHFGKTANSKETKYYESSNNKQSNNNNETTPQPLSSTATS